MCMQPLEEGEIVVQVVEDVHTAYDREVVLHTYHRSCWQNPDVVTHDCPHCGFRFYLALLRQGDDYQNLSRRFFCPFCATSFDCGMAT